MNAPRLARRPEPDLWLIAVALAVAAPVLWLPLAAWPSLVAASAGALTGALAGLALARGDLRGPVVVGAMLAALAAAGLAGGIGTRIPALLVSPEAFASLRDALFVAALSAAAAAVLAFFVARVRGLGPLVAAVVVLAFAALLTAHRDGAIHRPHEIADRAWLNGLHPALLLAGIGAFAGLLASLALLRFNRTRKTPWQLLLLVLLAIVLVNVAPGIGVFSFSTVDPLGLSDDPPQDRTLLGRDGDGAPVSGAEGGQGDPLGLRPADGSGTEDGELVPFRDEYPQDGAQAPVAVVILHDDVDPFGGALYFRQIAFSRWNGRRLVRAFDPRIDADLFDRYPTLGAIERDAPPGDSPRHDVPTTVALMREHSQPPVLADGVRIEPRPLADTALFKRSYAARSRVLETSALELLGRTADMDAAPEQVRRVYSELPDDPRYAELAEQALLTIEPQYREDPWARAISVAIWLEQNTSYSLRSRHAGAADPTASFLFGDRVGYCVHLAHAASFLMRALGLPARVAAGYSYAASDRASGSAIMLRAGDAHAWAEVWLDGVGWVPVDPSPPSLDPPLPRPDLDLQRLLGELARPQDQRLATAGAPQVWRRWSLRRVAFVALLAALVSWLVAGHAAKLWRRVAPRISHRDPSARLAYRATLDRLAEAGLSRGTGETREAFATRARHLSPAFAELTDEHLSAAFGRRSVACERSLGLSSRAAKEIARGAGRSRWLGALSPWSWTRSR